LLFGANSYAKEAGTLIDDMWIAEDDKGALLKKAELWEDGVLPLEFAKKFSSEQRQQLLDACAEWSQVANVRCVVGKYKGRTLQVGGWFNACWALWGMGSHALILRRRMNLHGDCFSRHTLLHELGHAFGMMHEHQRPDRNHAIRILSKNLQKGFLGFASNTNIDPQQMKLETSYDFESIMHYSRKAFSKNGRDTIVPLPQYSQFIDVIGRSERISILDAQAMAKAYGPKI